MKNLMKTSFFALGLFFLVSCSSPSTVKPDEMDKLKAENQNLTTQLGEKDAQIGALNEKLMSLSMESSNTIESQKNQIQTLSNLIRNLNQEVEAGNMKVNQTENSIRVTFLDNIFFDEGSAEIKADGKKSLDKLIPILKYLKEKIIRVEGYTDNVPIKDSFKWKYPSNWELSTARADAIVRYLQDKGISPDVLKAAGYGKYNPAASNDTEKGRAQNRRIVVELVPMDTRDGINKSMPLTKKGCVLIQPFFLISFFSPFGF